MSNDRVKAFENGEIDFELFDTDGELKIDKLKEVVKTSPWYRTPRNLTLGKTEHFYYCMDETGDRRIKLVLRPSRRLQIQESLLKVIPDRRGQPAGDYGHTKELVVDEEFYENVKDMSQEPPVSKSPTSITWK